MAEQEWTDPRYVDLVAAWRESQRRAPYDPEPIPVRGFVVRPPQPE